MPFAFILSLLVLICLFLLLLPYFIPTFLSAALARLPFIDKAQIKGAGFWAFADIVISLRLPTLTNSHLVIAVQSIRVRVLRDSWRLNIAIGSAEVVCRFTSPLLLVAKTAEVAADGKPAKKIGASSMVLSWLASLFSSVAVVIGLHTLCRWVACCIEEACVRFELDCPPPAAQPSLPLDAALQDVQMTSLDQRLHPRIHVESLEVAPAAKGHRLYAAVSMATLEVWVDFAGDSVKRVAHAPKSALHAAGKRPVARFPSSIRGVAKGRCGLWWRQGRGWRPLDLVFDEMEVLSHTLQVTVVANEMCEIFEIAWRLLRESVVARQSDLIQRARKQQQLNNEMKDAAAKKENASFLAPRASRASAFAFAYKGSSLVTEAGPCLPPSAAEASTPPQPPTPPTWAFLPLRVTLLKVEGHFFEASHPSCLAIDVDNVTGTFRFDVMAGTGAVELKIEGETANAVSESRSEETEEKVRKPIATMPGLEFSGRIEKHPEQHQHLQLIIPRAGGVWMGDGLMYWIFVLVQIEKTWKVNKQRRLQLEALLVKAKKEQHSVGEEREGAGAGGGKQAGKPTIPLTAAAKDASARRSSEPDVPRAAALILKKASEIAMGTHPQPSPSLHSEATIHSTTKGERAGRRTSGAVSEHDVAFQVDEADVTSRESFRLEVGEVVLRSKLLNDRHVILTGDHFVMHMSTAAQAVTIAAAPIRAFECAAESLEQFPHTSPGLLLPPPQATATRRPKSPDRSGVRKGDWPQTGRTAPRFWEFIMATDGASVRLPSHGKNVSLRLGEVRGQWRWIVLPTYWYITEAAYVDYYGNAESRLLSVYRTPAPPEPQVSVEVYSVVVNFSPKLQIHTSGFVFSLKSAASMTISFLEPVMYLTPPTDWVLPHPPVLLSSRIALTITSLGPRRAKRRPPDAPPLPPAPSVSSLKEGEIGKKLTVEILDLEVICTEVTDAVYLLENVEPFMSHLLRDAPTPERLDPFLYPNAKTADEKLRAAAASAVSAVELRIVNLFLVAMRCMQDTSALPSPAPSPRRPQSPTSLLLSPDSPTHATAMVTQLSKDDSWIDEGLRDRHGGLDDRPCESSDSLRRRVPLLGPGTRNRWNHQVSNALVSRIQRLASHPEVEETLSYRLRDEQHQHDRLPLPRLDSARRLMFARQHSRRDLPTFDFGGSNSGRPVATGNRLYDVSDRSPSSISQTISRQVSRQPSQLEGGGADRRSSGESSTFAKALTRDFGDEEGLIPRAEESPLATRRASDSAQMLQRMLTRIQERPEHMRRRSCINFWSRIYSPLVCLHIGGLESTISLNPLDEHQLPMRFTGALHDNEVQTYRCKTVLGDCIQADEMLGLRLEHLTFEGKCGVKTSRREHPSETTTDGPAASPQDELRRLQDRVATAGASASPTPGRLDCHVTVNSDGEVGLGISNSVGEAVTSLTELTQWVEDFAILSPNAMAVIGRVYQVLPAPEVRAPPAPLPGRVRCRVDCQLPGGIRLSAGLRGMEALEMLIPALQLFALLDACLPPPTREDRTLSPHRETGDLPYVAILSTRLDNGLVVQYARTQLASVGSYSGYSYPLVSIPEIAGRVRLDNVPREDHHDDSGIFPSPTNLFLEVFLRGLLRGDTVTSTSQPPRRLGTAEPYPTLERRHSQRRRSETLQPPIFALVEPAQCLTINVSPEHLHLILQLLGTPQMDRAIRASTGKAPEAHTTRGIARRHSSIWLTKATAGGEGGGRGAKKGDGAQDVGVVASRRGSGLAKFVPRSRQLSRSYTPDGGTRLDVHVQAAECHVKFGAVRFAFGALEVRSTYGRESTRPHRTASDPTAEAVGADAGGQGRPDGLATAATDHWEVGSSVSSASHQSDGPRGIQREWGAKARGIPDALYLRLHEMRIGMEYVPAMGMALSDATSPHSMNIGLSPYSIPTPTPPSLHSPQNPPLPPQSSQTLRPRGPRRPPAAPPPSRNATALPTLDERPALGERLCPPQMTLLLHGVFMPYPPQRPADDVLPFIRVPRISAKTEDGVSVFCRVSSPRGHFSPAMQRYLLHTMKVIEVTSSTVAAYIEGLQGGPAPPVTIPSVSSHHGKRGGRSPTKDVCKPPPFLKVKFTLQCKDAQVNLHFVEAVEGAAGPPPLASLARSTSPHVTPFPPPDKQAAVYSARSHAAAAKAAARGRVGGAGGAGVTVRGAGSSRLSNDTLSLVCDDQLASVFADHLMGIPPPPLYPSSPVMPKDWELAPLLWRYEEVVQELAGITPDGGDMEAADAGGDLAATFASQQSTATAARGLLSVQRGAGGGPGLAGTFMQKVAPPHPGHRGLQMLMVTTEAIVSADLRSSLEHRGSTDDLGGGGGHRSMPVSPHGSKSQKPDKVAYSHMLKGRPCPLLDVKVILQVQPAYAFVGPVAPTGIHWHDSKEDVDAFFVSHIAEDSTVEGRVVGRDKLTGLGSIMRTSAVSIALESRLPSLDTTIRSHARNALLIADAETMELFAQVVQKVLMNREAHGADASPGGGGGGVGGHSPTPQPVGKGPRPGPPQPSATAATILLQESDDDEDGADVEPAMGLGGIRHERVRRRLIEVLERQQLSVVGAASRSPSTHWAIAGSAPTSPRRLFEEGRQAQPDKIHLEYILDQVSVSLIRQSGIFCRASMSGINGMMEFLLDVKRSSTFELDIGSINIEDVQEDGNSSFALTPLAAEGVDLEGQSQLLSIRGADRFVKLFGKSWQVFDSVQIQAAPLRVDLTQDLVRALYDFVFPPTKYGDDKDKDAAQQPSPRPAEKDKNVPPPPQRGRKEGRHGAAGVPAVPAVPTLPTYIFFKYLRVSPIVAEINFKGTVNLNDIALELTAFVQQRKLKPWKGMCDKYMWHLAKQGAGKVAVHKLKDLLPRGPKANTEQVLAARDADKKQILFGKM
ncbi:unnamed protein product [Vitrella brassicaformis CCMP3155]|uniref:Uncharacterized protein n=3 Tax=Vitrella brassicaformis TaxID=1169539 RepID=A0A0G4H1B9_VITBC|nr:unnamed protein product [Vitrella brassicaformis CCMP3155]|eukprot:CEM37392.1 unnamed protein product [Vitrella brassicaformis CCMP3155]